MDRELSDGEIVDSDSEQEVPIQSETVLGNVVFYNSTRGQGNKLECIGHAYNVGKRHPERIIYYCDKRIKYKCPGSVVYYQNKNSIEIVREHNHPVDQSKIEAEKIKRSLYAEASKNPGESSRRLINAHFKRTTPDVLIRLPGYESLSRVVRRNKQNADLYIPEPFTFDEIDHNLLQQFKSVLGEELLLLKTAEPSPLIVFATDTNLDVLRECEIIAVDGTFDVVPSKKVFKQLWIIQGLFEGKFLPLVFCLMKKKKLNNYLTILDKISDYLSPNLRYVIMDFERSVMNAFLTKFDELNLTAEIHGCYFHFDQSLFRKIKKFKWDQAYKDKGTVYFALKRFFYLPFVKLEHIVLAYEFCCAELERLGSVYRKFTKYMDYTWIGKRDKNGHRGQPLFPHHIWNCYTFTLEYLPRSNNAIEALNNAFKVSANVARPTLAYFMNRLVEEHAKTHFNILHPPQGIKLTEKELYLMDVVRNYDYCRNFSEYFNDLMGVVLLQL